MPFLTATRKFEFASSHFLENYKGKCEHMHGHNYKLHITVKGEIANDGLVMDFADIKKIVKNKVIEKLDHKHLNDILKNPTAEHISIWIWDALKDHMPLHKIKLYETDNCYVEYEG
ncbi:6-carboxytetrahydropterin synthase QueD [Candidatus Peregrinibacteria bacterium]|nr:6-carboxytetrahydropterin synthase QueD [Candidatus Peregrinibacteria bacterium]